MVTFYYARVAKLEYALDLSSNISGCAGSSPAACIFIKIIIFITFINIKIKILIYSLSIFFHINPPACFTLSFKFKPIDVLAIFVILDASLILSNSLIKI